MQIAIQSTNRTVTPAYSSSRPRAKILLELPAGVMVPPIMPAMGRAIMMALPVHLRSSSES